MPDRLLDELAEGRTELVFDFIAAGHPAGTIDSKGVSLIHHCAYYGDVSAIRFLLANGESVNSLGEDYGLHAAAYHGHWRLCKFLLEQGADVNRQARDTGETALHNAISKTDRLVYDRVVKVLLAHGADPNIRTKPGVETGAFMRDCRTKGETPLHRAAAFGEEETIKLLLEAGAVVDAKDMHGDTPLSWASWYGRPTPVLRLLLYGDFGISPNFQGMRANLLGKPLI
jgi:ankyrin repeat protein